MGSNRETSRAHGLRNELVDPHHVVAEDKARVVLILGGSAFEANRHLACMRPTVLGHNSLNDV